MKLLHIVPSIEVATGGGLGAAALALHRQLLADGEDSALITTASAIAGSSSFEKVTQLPLIRPNPFFYGPHNRMFIDKAVRAADVVHMHGLYTHLNFCVGASCRRWEKPLVYHPHGVLAPWYRRRRPLAKQFVRALFEERNFRLVRLWRAVSEREEQDIRHLFPRANVVVIPNGIDPAEFETNSSDTHEISSVDPSRRVLLFIGRLAQVKGLDLLVRAWRELRNFHREWQLVIAGPDFENYRARLRAQLANLEPSAAPQILGSVAGENKVRLLKRADLFVLPSRGEGLPITVLEALASSTPVLITDACNFSDVDLGEAGWICDLSAESLKNSLADALTHSPAELRAKGECGRRIVEQKFNRKRMSADLVAHSKRLLVDLPSKNFVGEKSGIIARAI